VQHYNHLLVLHNYRSVAMGRPVVHFEVIGSDPAALRRYYGDLFGWAFDTGGPVAASVSEPGGYGFVTPGDENGIPGGVGGGAGHEAHVVFYVGVEDVELALQEAERLGGTRRMGPEQAPGGAVVVGHFADPEGNLVGVAAAA
jgi:predicted enzyme related to lactoylglutathione lyase